MTYGNSNAYVLAFDTSNEVIAIGVGTLAAAAREIKMVASREVAAHRASNTQLLPQIDALLKELDIAKSAIACIACGRGPGSFTGVRICMATAKGLASALEVPLFGVSTLDAIAWQMQAAGFRGDLLVAADAMRKEVYPVRFVLDETGIARLNADTVMKAEIAAQNILSETDAKSLIIAGDALFKYQELFSAAGSFVEETLWTPTGKGLLLAVEAAWHAGEIDPFDVVSGNPAFALPVYTRLSDAEENERIRMSKNDPVNLRSGVQETGVRRDQQACVNDTAILNAKPDAQGIVYRPLDAAHAADAAILDREVMALDAWSAASFADDLSRKDRVWWAAYTSPGESDGPAQPKEKPAMVGYAGGWIIEGRLEILKVATIPEYRRRGIASSLLALLAADARDLGAQETSLEVRSTNVSAQEFYRELGLKQTGMRPHYYSGHKDAAREDAAREDVAREDAVIMTGPLPLLSHDVAGMHLEINPTTPQCHSERSSCRPEAKPKEPWIVTSLPSVAPHNDDIAPQCHSERSEQSERSRRIHVADAQVANACALKNLKNSPLILAIETSCDETAAAIVDGNGTLLSDVVASQIDFHARFGGVVPEIASRKHIEAICGVTQECLDVAATKLNAPTLRWKDLDAVAVTYAPGLVGALVVGVAFAKAAAWGADVPFLGINHLEGHIYASKIATPDVAPPMVVSLVSGGHTMLVYASEWGKYETLGETLDDAVGEAFDKVAKAMGLGYPGGPAISKLAVSGNPKAIDFPRAMMHSGDLRFSLSGLKTAVITYLQNEEKAGRAVNKADVAASFQQAVIDVQVAKAETALKQTGAKEFCLGGGVAANPALREAYQAMCARINVRLTLPPFYACTDNAGMIALAALDRFHAGDFFALDADAYASAPL